MITTELDRITACLLVGRDNAGCCVIVGKGFSLPVSVEKGFHEESDYRVFVTRKSGIIG